MELSADSLLKPLRRMSGQRAPGDELGGWYLYDPNADGPPSAWGLLQHVLSGNGSLRILEHTTDVALPHLPGKAIEHESLSYIFSGASIPSNPSVSTKRASTNSVRRSRNARFCSSGSVRMWCLW
jgi:hypothetical protein